MSKLEETIALWDRVVIKTKIEDIVYIPVPVGTVAFIYTTGDVCEVEFKISKNKSILRTLSISDLKKVPSE